MFRRFKAFEASPIYQFKDPDTGFIQKAASLTELYKNIIMYRLQNNLEAIESLREVVENYLCGLPENCNKCQENVEIERSFSQYIKGGIALLKNMAFNRFVTQDVAEKRALQCTQCKFNVFPDRGPFLKWADEIAVSQVGERKTSYDNELGNCEVCTCVLKSKVFYDGKLDKFSDEEVVKMKSVSCWQLQLSGQYK